MHKLLTTALCMLVPLGLIACGKKAEKTTQPPPAKVVAKPAEPQATAAEMISAMLRGHPNSKQVCVDGERERAFFLDYGPLLPIGVVPDGKFHGWYFIEKVDFYKTSNNTWFITDQKDDTYLQVYPDVTGLTCRAQ